MKLQFDPALCVRAKSKFSTCDSCVKASCGHIVIDEHLPTFSKTTGIEAAGSVGACPSEAFSIEGVDLTAFVFSFLQEGKHRLDTDDTLPSLALLSVEHLIALVLASNRIIEVNVASLKENVCLYELFLERLEEANFVLEGIGASTITVVDEPIKVESREVASQKEDSATEHDRRNFFKKTFTLEGIAEQKRAFDSAVQEQENEWQRFEIDEAIVQKIKQKHLPEKRKLLLTALKRFKPDHYEIFAQEDISFISQKYVEESCSNCQICYRICPTGALNTTPLFSAIYFDAMLCIKCKLCHDVCEPDAIKLQPGFESKEFFEPTTRTLVKFTARRCHECGNIFTYFDGEQICPRCRLEEEEARELHENARRMKQQRSGHGAS